MKEKEYKVGKIRLNVISKAEIIDFLNNNIDKANGYICVTNTRTAYLSDKDPNYASIQNNSLLTIPDGMPLVWLGRLKGYKEIERTAGPEIFKEILESGATEFKHYLLGDTQEVLDKLENKCKEQYKVSVVGSFSPPFLDVEEFDYRTIAKNINLSGANVVWVALGSPKQDIFAAKLIEHTNNKILINVGAAFRFVLGTYKMPSKTVQKMGMTGVYWRFLERPSLFLTKYPKYVWFLLQNVVKNSK